MLTETNVLPLHQTGNNSNIMEQLPHDARCNLTSALRLRTFVTCLQHFILPPFLTRYSGNEP